MDLTGRWDIPAVERFLAKVYKIEDGCWLWTGALSGGRYGGMMVGGKSTVAHRFSYEHFVGPIPEGAQIDHICGVTVCVNPEHLRALTAGENARAYHREQKRLCRNGHDLRSPDATVVRYGGRTIRCRQCERDTKNRYKRKTFVPAPPPTTCRNGHPKELSYVTISGGMLCRECQKAIKARYRAKLKATLKY